MPKFNALFPSHVKVIHVALRQIPKTVWVLLPSRWRQYVPPKRLLDIITWMTVWVASTLTKEAVCPFEILVPTYLMNRCYDTKRWEHELVCCKYGDSMSLRNDGTLLRHCWYNCIKILRYWHHCFFSPHDLCGQSKWTWTSKGQIPLAVWLLVQVVYLVRGSSSASSHISTYL